MVIVVVETIKKILPIIEITINKLRLLYYLHSGYLNGAEGTWKGAANPTL